ncbi:MAG: fasciclin domain-containing protein [Chloroflexi bacterium]|nr:fasciclin domain-containing protein [Chloroflexota bacterium]
MRPFILLFLGWLCIWPVSAQEDADLIAIIVAENDLSIFHEALAETDWGLTLTQDGQFTVFAPTDEAFARAFERLETTKEDFFAHPDRLASLLSFHVVAGAMSLEELRGETSVMPYRRSSLVIDRQDDELLLNREARVLQGDLAASNGWLHIVDTVLLAPGEFAIEIADNLSFLVLGLAVVALLVSGYLSSLFWRWRLVNREATLLRSRIKEAARNDQSFRS